jgi:hypothetical protein
LLVLREGDSSFRADRTLPVCGESMSGCMCAGTVDAYSIGFHVTIEGTFDG